MIAVLGASGFIGSSLVVALIFQKKESLTIDIAKPKGNYNWNATYPYPRSLEVVDALAKKRDSEVGVKFDQAFVLIKEFVE